VAERDLVTSTRQDFYREFVLAAKAGTAHLATLAIGLALLLEGKIVLPTIALFLVANALIVAAYVRARA
jgi:hypothetical protein